MYSIKIKVNQHEKLEKESKKLAKTEDKLTKSKS